jgi:RNA polymerase sigma factor (TIGR02999 family)
MSCLPTLLWDSKAGSPSASEPAFLDLVYEELHRMASSLLRHERAAHTLQTSALVNEAFLRLSAAHSLRVEDRQHFLRIAAHSMRQILIDYARSRHTQKRDGLERVDLDACQK